MQSLRSRALLLYGFFGCIFIDQTAVSFAQVSDVEQSVIENDKSVKIEIDIPKQELGNALMALSSQSGLNIIGLSAEMESVDGTALSGLMTPRQALEGLLRGSGFTYRFVGNSSISILKSPLKIEASDLAVLEEVVVTADRRNSDLQNSSVAITHLSNQEITTNQFRDLRDIASWVPGLEFASTGPQESVLVQLRGVGTTNITEIADGPVSINIDGIYSPAGNFVWP